MRFAVLAAVLAGVCMACRAEDTRGYYRFPTIHGDSIVFTSEGDLWQVSTSGGLAKRLTTHPAEEVMAAFSPNGATIAFSASYEGPREVYTMPAEGGLPQRRTFDGAEASVTGWTPDGKILYATDRFSPLPINYQLLTIDAHNRAERIPLAQAAQGVYDDTGTVLSFTRLGRAVSYTKRYLGGSAEQLWKYDGKGEAVPLTGDYPGTSKNAMFWRHRVYFLSHRDGSMNIWSMDEDGHNLRQQTHHSDFGIQSAALDSGRIVYQIAGDLRLYDIASGKDRVVPIELPSDFDSLREHWIQNPLDYISSIYISQDGARLAVTTRGRTFLIPAQPGRIVDVTNHTPGRFREARLMPDGKSVLVLSTQSGESELWLYPATGGTPSRLTNDGHVLRWNAVPSPNGKLIAHQDKDQNLWLLDVASKANTQIASQNDGNVDDQSFADLRWSPDSKYLTFTRNAKNYFTQIVLYEIATGASTVLTTDRYNSGSASWSADGKWLYFLSDRSLNSVIASP